jgi:predicted nucleotidyltransferase
MVKIKKELLGEITRRIKKIAHPRKIILFGSHARGNAKSRSDIDILVVSDNSRPRHQRSAPIYGALSDIILPMDIVVYTPKEIEEWSNVPEAFISTAVREGKVLYEN